MNVAFPKSAKASAGRWSLRQQGVVNEPDRYEESDDKSENDDALVKSV